MQWQKSKGCRSNLSWNGFLLFKKYNEYTITSSNCLRTNKILIILTVKICNSEQTLTKQISKSILNHQYHFKLNYILRHRIPDFPSRPYTVSYHPPPPPHPAPFFIYRCVTIPFNVPGTYLIK